MKNGFGIVLIAVMAMGMVHGDIEVVNDLIKPEEVYDFLYSEDSDVWWRNTNVTKYYCVFRSEWTKERHPKDYPEAARWTNNVLYSTTKDWRPWLKNRQTTVGIETIAEKGFTDTFHSEAIQAGKRVLDYQEADGFYIDQEHWKENYVYMPPIQVSFDYPFLNAVAGMFPSPDWFTGFYLFDTVDEYDRTFWKRFTIRTYPWDAGTDSGQSYESNDRDVDKYGVEEPSNVFRIYPNSAPSSGAFLSPDGKQVLPVGEYSCILHVCDTNEPDCVKPDWPPKNYCDVLKYPNCATYCDPKTDVPCEPCKGNGYEPKLVYHNDCCAAGKDPRLGKSCAEREQLEKDDESNAYGGRKTFATAVVGAVMAAAGMCMV